VTLDVVVTDATGHPVAGLQKRDFTLLDNTQPQDLVAFQAANGFMLRPDPPVELILLVDAVNTAYPIVAQERQMLDRFFKANGGRLPLPTSLVVLTDKGPNLQKEPTRDGKTLAAILKGNQAGLRALGRATGSWGAYERRQEALEALARIAAWESQRPGRKLLVWIGQGWPSFSGASWLKTRQNDRDIYSDILILSRSIAQARLTIYCIDPRGMGPNITYYRNFIDGVSSPEHTDYGDLMLQVLATQSGGRVVLRSNELSTLISLCIQDAKAYYVLTYDAPAADRRNEYHRVEVKIDKPGLTVRTRTGYYAP